VEICAWYELSRIIIDQEQFGTDNSGYFQIPTLFSRLCLKIRVECALSGNGCVATIIRNLLDNDSNDGLDERLCVLRLLAVASKTF
jgi:hypothetical protein